MTCDRDEEWQASRCLSEKKMSEPCDGRAAGQTKAPPAAERASELRVIARKAIDASLELADELEAA